MASVAIFVDYENIHWTAQNDYKRYPEGELFARLFRDIGKDQGNVLSFRAYADWTYFQQMQTALDGYGCYPVFVASKLRSAPERGARKNSADIQLAIDVMDTLHLKNEIDTFVFFSGDRDFIGLVKRLKQEGKRVVVSGFRTSMSEELARHADVAVILDTHLGWDPIVAKPRRAQETRGSDNWEPLIKRLARLDRLPARHWHYVRKVMYWKDLEPSPVTREERDGYLNRAKEAGIIHVKLVPNEGENRERFPYVSSIDLNLDHPEVQRVLRKLKRK